MKKKAGSTRGYHVSYALAGMAEGSDGWAWEVDLVAAGPTSNGFIVQWGGGDFNLIFVVTPAFFLLAILCMSQVTRGEAR